MPVRILPALGAGLMLAACVSNGAPGQDATEGVVSAGALTPGSIEDEPCGFGNIGNTLNFTTDSAVLTAEAQKYAQRQACWIQLYPQHNLTIEGHADERGTREYNLALGDRRAQAVMDYFVALGIDRKRLKAISYGKERPTCTEPTEACWSQNRRTVTTLDD
ncbi:peptidoglycan-associated lipoprotein Pal [Dongia sedimenti]|uniref:Peptidoglycan-associated lipoprotein n=1 Tax=Dongia sedimenti TaxID=3064282 RepID=A0ABU0YMD0_9PROT|nr:peptidoglycan-associated lipoprotein Pal [Rhodospirillaceae bacterium R-7]